MIRWLYNHIPGFRKKVNSLIYENQIGKEYKPQLTYVFSDLGGYKYYKFNNELELPLTRKGKLDMMMTELDAALSHKELSMICDGIEKSLQNIVNDVKQRVRVDELSKIGFFVREIRDRKQSILHPEIFINILSCVYIREDENPAAWDDRIFQEKVKAIKEEMESEPLRPFFQSQPWKEYMPFINISPDKLKDFMQEQQSRITALKKMYQSITSQELKSVEEVLNAN